MIRKVFFLHLSKFIWSTLLKDQLCHHRFAEGRCHIQNWLWNAVRNDVQNCNNRSGNTAALSAAASQSEILSICYGTRKSSATGNSHSQDTVSGTRQHITSHLHDTDCAVDSERRRWLQQKRSPNCKLPLFPTFASIINYINSILLLQVLRNIHWYTERSISEISLGGLLILVVIRTIQYNMLKMRDKYLHTNCLAALANMSGQFRSLHPYVAQRLVSLFEILAKKHVRLDADMKQLINGGVASGAVTVNVNALSSVSKGEPANAAAVRSMVLEDLSVLEEVLRMVLEILNSCISHQLVYCPNLIYTLLYKRQVFEAFRSHPSFQDIIQNIDMVWPHHRKRPDALTPFLTHFLHSPILQVVGFFSSRLQRVQEQRGGELGVQEVFEVISKGATQWSNDRLRVSVTELSSMNTSNTQSTINFFISSQKFPDLKFKYVEEDAPEEFFIPYVWTLVTKYGCVHFNSEGNRAVSTELSC